MSRNAIINIAAFAVFVILMVISYFARPPQDWKDWLLTFAIVLAFVWVVVTIAHLTY
jgi:hypothetical protein